MTSAGAGQTPLCEALMEKIFHEIVATKKGVPMQVPDEQWEELAVALELRVQSLETQVKGLEESLADGRCKHGLGRSTYCDTCDWSMP